MDAAPYTGIHIRRCIGQRTIVIPNEIDEARTPASCVCTCIPFSLPPSNMDEESLGKFRISHPNVNFEIPFIEETHEEKRKKEKVESHQKHSSSI